MNETVKASSFQYEQSKGNLHPADENIVPSDLEGKDIDDLLNLFSSNLRCHSRRVAICSALMVDCAQGLNSFHMTQSGMNITLIAHLGGTCHDIGKLLLPTLGVEHNDYLKHPIIGAELLEKHKKILFDNAVQAQMVHEIVLYHHERPDGTGYPEGLASEDIPLTAAVCSIADRLDHRLHTKEPPIFNDVLQEFRQQSGIEFTENAVICFERAWPLLAQQYCKWNRHI